MLLVYLTLAFSTWMLVDAIRRRAEPYWFFIIMLLPFGQWIYFFVIKIHDWDRKNGGAPFKFPSFGAPTLNAPSGKITALRTALEETPSTGNKLALGQALLHTKQFAAAAELFVQVLSSDQDDREALYGLALCEIGAGEIDAGVPRLQRLIELDSGFADFEPWFDLSFAQWNLNNAGESIGTLQRLVEVSPRLKHKSILAKYLVRSKRNQEAKSMLEEVFADYENLHGYVKRSNSRWHTDAKRTYKEIR